MGNEASLEGEGPGGGLPLAAAAAAPDGRGGFVVPGGGDLDLRQLGEEERRQLVAAMSRTRQGCVITPL